MTPEIEKRDATLEAMVKHAAGLGYRAVTATLFDDEENLAVLTSAPPALLALTGAQLLACSLKGAEGEELELVQGIIERCSSEALATVAEAIDRTEGKEEVAS